MRTIGRPRFARTLVLLRAPGNRLSAGGRGLSRCAGGAAAGALNCRCAIDLMAGHADTEGDDNEKSRDAKLGWSRQDRRTDG